VTTFTVSTIPLKRSEEVKGGESKNVMLPEDLGGGYVCIQNKSKRNIYVKMRRLE
jgi:hypothetical protein